MHFEVIGRIENVEIIVVGGNIRDIRDLEYIKLPRGTSNDEVPAR
jgi:hypothetical protein